MDSLTLNSPVQLNLGHNGMIAKGKHVWKGNKDKTQTTNNCVNKVISQYNKLENETNKYKTRYRIKFFSKDLCK